MNPPKQDSAYVNVASPYESASYRPMTDPFQDDDNTRIVGTIQYTDTDLTATSSYNMYVTQGGTLAQRPPFVNTLGTAILTNVRIDRMWYYQTLPTSAGVIYRYVLMSGYNYATSLWEMYYWRTDTSLSYTKFTNLRNVNDSLVAHWVVISQGKAYVRAFPGSGDTYGTIIFDGSTGTPAYRFWGVPGPTTPVRMSGWTGRTDAAVTATATSFDVSAVSAPPATPFVLYTGYEQMNVTAKAGAGPYTLTVTRGYNGTTAAAYGAEQRVVSRDWNASAHQVDVTVGWKYTYCYESATGQVSNSVDIERNPDLMGSDTGPFKDLKPKMTITGTADTTNIPYINMYRTMDGQANFLFLEQVANSGAGSITYVDDSFGTGASSNTFEDPVPDTKLDSARVAPTQYSNSPPPTVNAPLVTGTNYPDRTATKVVWFQRRLWYAIGNKLYYSSDEEITDGNPEESFKAGVKGNVITCQYRITSIEATSRDLYVMTAGGPVFIVYGSSAETGFVMKQIADGLPMSGNATGGSDSSVSFLDRVAFMTNDGRVCVISGESVSIISDPIQGLLSGSVKMYFYRDWLICLIPNGDVFPHGAMLLYDWKRSMREQRDFWHTPWTHRLRTLLPTLDFYENAGILIGATYDGSGVTPCSGLVFLDTSATTLRDSVITSAAYTQEEYDCSARFQPFKLPVGNHANGHAQPGMTPAFYGVRVDYQSSQTTAPTVEVFTDNNLSTGGTALIVTKPTRRRSSTGYKTVEARMFRTTQDVAIRVGNDDMLPQARLEILRMATVWFPEAGT